MSNTTTMQGTTITIVPDGSTDWDWQTDTAIPAELRTYGCFINSIQMSPGAQNDEIKVRDGSSTGIIFCKLKAPEATPTDKIKLFHEEAQKRKPYIATADCTWANTMLITIEID